MTKKGFKVLQVCQGQNLLPCLFVYKGDPYMKSLLTVITLISGLVFAQVRAFAALPNAEPKNTNVVTGQKAIEARDFKSAVGILKKAVQENPSDADAHTMLAYSYRKLGVFDKSMEHYQKALEIDSNHRSAREYLGELYLDMNQPANAEKQLEALKKTCPLLGQCAEYTDLVEAIDQYKRNHPNSSAQL
jgi:Tfp pilus assembly protein PilF